MDMATWLSIKMKKLPDARKTWTMQQSMDTKLYCRLNKIRMRSRISMKKLISWSRTLKKISSNQTYSPSFLNLEPSKAANSKAIQMDPLEDLPTFSLRRLKMLKLLWRRWTTSNLRKRRSKSSLIRRKTREKTLSKNSIIFTSKTSWRAPMKSNSKPCSLSSERSSQCSFPS